MSTPPARFRSRWMAGARFVLQRGMLKPVVWSQTRVTVRGTEHLRGLHRPFIVVANHSSHLDAPLVFGALPRPLARWLAAGAAADYFFDVRWRRWLTALFFNAYPVDRLGRPRRPRLSHELLASGVPLLLFPEGGRARNGESMGEFKGGAAALALGNRVPVVPVGIIGAQQAMPRDRSWPVRGRPPVAVIFGEPMRAAEGESIDEFTRQLQKQVAELCSQSIDSVRRQGRRG